ncbi:MAG: hypothetical protein Q9220_000954, partial [cf. Caloplaca sp. 1 TL-2023]
TTYLDHAGSTTYPQSLVKEYGRVMNTHLFGNPHSQSPSSSLSTQYIETARRRMLSFFHADPDHFDLVFVANATAAIKLVIDGISGSASDQGFWYGYHTDSHTSLVGPRELASAGSRCFFTDKEVSQWFSESLPLQNQRSNTHHNAPTGLFAYPAQSNMNGRRLPLDWPGKLRRVTAQANRQIYSLLDAAAFVATAQLDLSDHDNAPDFTALSFYKIFGFPDLGALIVRKDASHVLFRRKYFGGGTVDMVINDADDVWHATKQGATHEALEDGTPAFHSIIALHCALDVHTRLYGCMKNVSQHTGCLAAALHNKMSSLTHSNGLPVCTIYKDADADYRNPKIQGPTIAFNLQTSSGTWIGKSNFERLATLNGIQLRTGGVCNPGGIATHLQLSPREMRQNFEEGLRCGNGFDEMNGKPTGIIRVSFGAMSSTKEVVHFMQFMNIFVDKGKCRNKGIHPLTGAPISEKYFESGQVCSKQQHSEKANGNCQHRKVAESQAKQPEGNDEHYIVQVSTLRSQCPVAACLTTWPSQEELWEHFESHGAHSRRRWKLPRLWTR